MIRLLPAIVFVLLLHAAMLLDAPILGLAAFLAFCLLRIVAKRLTAGHWRGCIGWLLVALLMTIALITTLSGGLDLSWIILLPPILINVGLFYLFGRTILPGREPLVTRFRRLYGGELTPEICRYTWGWTVFWVIFLGFSTVASLLAALYVNWATWSWIVNIGCPAAAAVAFLGEHLYRRRYLGHFGSASVIGTLRTMLRPEAWSLEAIDPATTG